jgi:hypothetical protein
MTMNKFEILFALAEGRIARRTACNKLKMTDKGLTMTMNAYAPHLPWLVMVLGELHVATKPQQTRVKQEIADRLQVKVNQVNRMLRHGKVAVPKPKIVKIREETRKKAEKKRENTQKVIKNLAKGRISAENAQKTLDISKRQVARHLSKLVGKTGYSVQDFRRLPRTERQKLVEAHG